MKFHVDHKCLIKCKECSKVYICETGRSFKLIIGEQKTNCKQYITGKSAIADYTTTHKHKIDFYSACVM